MQQQLAVDYLVLFGPLELDEGGIQGPHLNERESGRALTVGRWQSQL